MSKSSNYLLGCGCSWTDHEYFSYQHPDLDCSWPKWPQIVAEHLELDVVNVGKSGSSNEYAYIQIIDAIFSDNPPSHIMWQLTEWSRMQLGKRRVMPCKRYETFEAQSLAEKRFRPNNSSSEYLMGMHSFPLCLDGPYPILENSLFYIEKVIRICRQLDIKLHIFQSNVPMWPFTSEFFLNYLNEFEEKYPDKYKTFETIIDGRIENFFITDQILFKLLKSERFKSIEELNPVEVYGWPIWPSFGGKHITTQYQISEQDSHPSALGQQELAQKIIEWID